MNNEKSFIVYDGVEVASSAFLKPIRNTGYGSIPDLPDEELASPDELERQVVRAELEPVLLLPVKSKKNGYCPAWDYSEDVGFGAFGTVDFERGMPEFDKARYKAEKLEEEVQDRVIMFLIVNERIPGMNKYRVLKYVGTGVIAIDDIIDDDIRALAKLYLQIREVKKQVVELREFSRQKKERKARAFLESL